MLKPDSKILDDIARVASGAAGALHGFREQIREDIRQRVDETAQRMDLVPREDFERVEAMLVKAREQQDKLVQRIETLEQELGKKSKTKTTKQKKTK